MKKKILVTGGAGFIGSHLVEKLVLQGYSVKTIVPYNINNSWGWIDSFSSEIKKNVEVVSGDICDQNFILDETKKIDIIFHLAALISIPYSYKSPQSYVSTNVSGTLNMLEAARENNVELFVQTSTSEVYGSSQFIPITEKHPLVAQSPYAATKIASDQLALSYYNSFELPVLILRPFNTFGPRQSLRAAIPTIITQLVSNKNKIKLGSLTPRRDFTYVSDTVDGFISAIGNKKCLGETINLGTGKDFSIGETVKNIENILRTKAEIVTDNKRIRPKKSEVNRLISSNLKAKKLLNWSPKLKGSKGFKEGLKKTIEWFNKEENLKLYKANLYNY
ncbi:GDP-mannose 4,6-dehydratase [Candidatus Pelagibacter sp.]|jgi:NAD dependent epimerase/dehydratase|nr:GDP-mannose 4,6-dehydratase [Candidatus Pelagibacter sp.]